MGKGGKSHYERRKQQRQAACILVTIILVIIIIILIVLYFSLYQPKDPKVQVPVMELLYLYPKGYPSATSSAINLTLNLQVSMYNPNRATFYITENSTACLYYQENQVGVTSFPPGSIPSQSFSTITVPLTVQEPGPLEGSYVNIAATTGILPVSTSVTIFGHVTTLNIFSHDTDVISKCDVKISFNMRGIESYTCQKSYSLYE